MKKTFCITLLTALILCFAVLCCAHAAVSQVLVLPEGTKVIEAEAFYGDTSIREVVLPEGVESIGERAFANSGVTKVNLPESVEYIAPNAFANVKHVYAYGEYGSYAEDWAKGKSNVTFMCRLTNTINWCFKDGVLNIVGSGVMPDYEYPVSGDAPWTEYRESVQRIVIGEGITKIGNYNFKYCENNTEIVFPSTLTYIGGGAFAFNYSIEQVTMPDSVTSTSWDIFIECKSLKYVKLSSNLRNLNTYVFSGTAIETITIPDSVVSIGHHAFYNCKNLTTVYVSKNVTTVGNAAFGNCPNLTIYGEAGTKVEEYAAVNGVQYVDPTTFIKDFTYTIANGKCIITGYTGTKTNVVIPSKIDGCPVTVIGEDAFNDCGSLTSISIPDSVTSIGVRAFCKCTSLTSISIPDGVTSIGGYAFYYCTSLTSITIPDKVTSIADSAFYHCTNLTSIIIPDGVTFIDGYAFAWCTSLTNIIIPDGVTSIGGYAFYYCTNLTNIIIPDGVTSIGRYAFYYCTNLTNIIIPDGVTSIGHSAFAWCTSLTSITIPDKVTSIADYAFYVCESLTDIVIPAGVTSIGYSAFASCTSLTNIIIPAGVTSIGGNAFHYCTNLTNIIIPDGVTSIGEGAFGSCTSLPSIIIPDSVNSIGRWAFSNCTSLTSISIPDSVTSIGEYAFCDCTSLTSISIPDGVTSIGDWAFDDCPNLTIYGVKGSSAETYAKDNNIPFKLFIPNPDEDALPAEYYEIINTYSYSGSTYFEANLIKNYNGITAPDPNYSSNFFFLDSKGRVVTDPTLLCKLYTIYMYVHNETTINNSISSLNSSAKKWSASALDFMRKKARWTVVGGVAGKLAGEYLGGGATLSGILKTIGGTAINNVKEGKELSSWLQIAFIKELLSHLDKIETLSVTIPVIDKNGIYQYDMVEAKLSMYAHFKNTYKAAQNMCMPVVDEILTKFETDNEVAMYYFATMLSEALSAANPILSLSMTMWNAAVTGSVSDMDAAKAIIEQIEFFSGLKVNAYKDIIDALAGLDKLFDTQLGISQATALKDENWLKPFYMTVDELKTTQLYKNHLLLAQ